MLESDPTPKKKSSLSSVVDLAAGEPGRRERPLDLFCRFRPPSTGRAVPYWAQQLLDALLSTNFELPELTLVMEDLEWLASSAEVMSLSQLPARATAILQLATAPHPPHTSPRPARIMRSRGRRPVRKIAGNVGSASDGKALSPKRSAPLMRIAFGWEAFAALVRKCMRSIARHSLSRASDPAPLAILKDLKLDLPPAQFIESLSSVESRSLPEALSRFRALQAHLAVLLENAPRLKSSRVPISISIRPKANDGGRKHGSPNKVRKTEVKVSWLKPKVDAKTARACSKPTPVPTKSTPMTSLFVRDTLDPVKIPHVSNCLLALKCAVSTACPYNAMARARALGSRTLSFAEGSLSGCA